MWPPQIMYSVSISSNRVHRLHQLCGYMWTTSVFVISTVHHDHEQHVKNSVYSLGICAYCAIRSGMEGTLTQRTLPTHGRQVEMSTWIFQKSRCGLAILVLATMLAVSASSLPLLLDKYAGTMLVTPALADDYEHGGD